MRSFVTSIEEASRALSISRSGDTELLIIRCKTSALDVVQQLEVEGARLMDTLLYYGRDFGLKELPTEEAPVSLRAARPADGQQLASLARECFRAYAGHYHADPKLDRDQCTEVYASWAQHDIESVSERSQVFLAEEMGSPLGFATVRLLDPSQAEIELNAISPHAQRRGIYRSLVLRAMHWSAAHGASRLSVSTQVSNLAPQKVWCRLGFEPTWSCHTLHQWFER